MTAISGTDWLVFIAVVGARFLLPLLIPYFPLPAIIACLLLDGVDQTIFQTFTKIDLSGYQSYDKALDIYYLTVAYISTFRNWTNQFAFKLSRFLFYFRLLGVVAFELSQWRALLLVFPNTFEYFFIWYESVRLLWDPRKLSKKTIVLATAAIWIFIKLPQEYWIHIAKRDATDTIKQLLGGTPESPWVPLIANNIVVILLVLAGIAVGLFLLIRFLRRRLPKPDHGVAWRADDYTQKPTDAEFATARNVWMERIFDRDLVEKAVLMSLITIIFSNILPNTTMAKNDIIIDVTVFVIFNTALSHILARRGTTFTSGVLHFLAVLAVNFGIVFGLGILLNQDTNWFNATFFILLLSLIVTLYDRFQPFQLARFPRGPLFRRQVA